MVSCPQNLGTPPPGTEGSRALRARNPKRVRKDRKGVPGPLAPGSPRFPKSAPRSPKRVQERSFGLFLDSFRTPGRTLGDFGAPAPGHPYGLFSDSFGVPGPKGPSVPGRGVPNPKPSFFFKACLPFFVVTSHKAWSSRIPIFQGAELSPKIPSRPVPKNDRTRQPAVNGEIVL